MNLQELLNTEINADSIKKAYRPIRYEVVKAARFLKKKKIGPGKCFIYFLALEGVANYLGYFESRYRIADGDPVLGALIHLSGYPIGLAGKAFFVAGGYLTIKKGYEKIKEKVKNRTDRVKNYYKNNFHIF